MKTSRLLTLLIVLVLIGSPVLAEPMGDYERSWIVVQLSRPLVHAEPDGSFSIRTGRDELDRVIRATGVHRISYALPVSAAAPADPDAFRRWGFDRTYLFHLPKGSDVLAMAGRFSTLSEVDFAEPDFVLERNMVPNDAMFGDQWNLHNATQTGGCDDADVDAPEAWDRSVGAEVVIAFLDTGIDSDHEDLDDKIVAGYDFFDGDSDPEDTDGHGTSVASVAAAETDNGVGIAGVCWNCRIMPIRISATSSQFADAMVWATDHGARIINMSQSTTSGSHTYLNGVGYAYDAGVIQVMSAGNAGASSVNYPAAYLETIAVGATTWCDNRLFFSNYGDALDVVAPGMEIPLAEMGGGYSNTSDGTSYSAPMVAGALAVLRSVHPSMGREEARHLLHAGADDEIGYPDEDTPGFDVFMGWGRANMDRSLQAAEAATTLRVTGKSSTRVYFETANPLATSYDFARGNLADLSEGFSGVDVGALTCLENDSADADTAGNEDTDTPAPGEAFFYLARFNATPGAGSYGGSSRNRDRMVFPQATSASWTAEGTQEQQVFGNSVNAAGDVNGDGYEDVIVGARFHDGSFVDEGAAFVYHGSPDGLSSNPAWSATGGQEGAQFGDFVASAGDVNCDGYDDVFVGAAGYDNGESNEGRAFVFHGSPSGLEPNPAWTVESDQVDAGLGGIGGSAGDVDGDGCSDVIVGTWGWDNGETDEGKAEVFHGSPAGLEGTARWTVEGNQASARLAVVGTAGDVNGDGFDDVVVGAPRYDNGETDEGRIYVYHGSAAGLEALPSATLEIDVADAWLGYAVITAGDVNCDGFDDVVGGATRFTGTHFREGKALVWYGSDSGIQPTPGWSFEGGIRGARLGNWTASAGDLDNDGCDDIIVGAYLYPLQRSVEGRVWVFLGAASGLNIDPVWSMSGMSTGAMYGWHFAGVDVDGDRLGEVLVGAPRQDGSSFDGGRAYLYEWPLSESPPIDCAR